MKGQVIHCTVDYCQYNEHRYCSLDTVQIEVQAQEMVDGEESGLPVTFCASFQAKDLG